MDDLISRQSAIDGLWSLDAELRPSAIDAILNMLNGLPSAQPTLYGYNIDHLKLIANILQKENLPPERVAEALIDISRIVAIVKDEFEEALRRAVEQCKI